MLAIQESEECTLPDDDELNINPDYLILKDMLVKKKKTEFFKQRRSAAPLEQGGLNWAWPIELKQIIDLCLALFPRNTAELITVS